MSHAELDRNATTYIAGHRGLVGSAVWRRFKSSGFSDLVGMASADLDLRERGPVFSYFEQTRPRYVVLAAAKVGGILANDTYPADYLSDNLRIQLNVMDAAVEHGVERLLFLGSSCIYPKLAPQPLKEEYLLTGHLESTNDAYAIAKIAGIKQVQAARKQHNRRWISAMPSNLYGPGDNFSGTGSHMLPALIRRFSEAKESGADRVTNWGSGRPLRELLHVDDLARACELLLEDYDSPVPINVGSGEDFSVRDISLMVAGAVGYTGEIHWDTSRPDGTPRKLLDINRVRALGWEPRIKLEDGIHETVSWYRDNRQPAFD